VVVTVIGATVAATVIAGNTQPGEGQLTLSLSFLARIDRWDLWRISPLNFLLWRQSMLYYSQHGTYPL
jgi:hypothetical protein